MKNLIPFILSFVSAFSFAQNSKIIILTKGQEIEVSTTSSSLSELSMGMTMNNNTATTSKLVVVDEDQDSYKLTSTLTKMKLSMEGMGKNVEYDSEKSEDKDSEIGKLINDKINKASNFLLNKLTGKITVVKGNESDENIGGMMSMSSMGDVATSLTGDAFLVISSDKKVGESWSDTTSINGLITKKNYKILSIQNDIANVELKETIKGTTEKEMQGNSIIMKTDAKLDGKITSNLKTGLVYMIKMDSEINGSVEAMGQEMPVSSKTTTTTLFNQ